jgi:positive regulator of sigma E activity
MKNFFKSFNWLALANIIIVSVLVHMLSKWEPKQLFDHAMIVLMLFLFGAILGFWTAVFISDIYKSRKSWKRSRSE